MRFIVFVLVLLGGVFYAFAQQQELRGVWIATVKMLDYPSKPGLNSYQLKQQYIKLLDSLQQININAIFFQIRPAADAFYYSKYEPWSEWLTGKQGKPPYPYFDPLKFFIEEAHKRGMQFHAWINPFRAIANYQTADVIPNHLTFRKPQWFFNYGLNRYFDPGIPQVRNYIVSIIADIVRRYDIDGIHFDDYFYPYPIRDENGKIIPIPDWQTFKKYGQGFNSIKQWRRHNITSFIKQVYDTIKSIKPYVQFGVSPNAIWRNKTDDPNGSNTRGLAAYDWLYADILLWDSLRIVDYIAPQLYFYIGHPYADYKELLHWWATHIKNAKLYIGLNINAVGKGGKWNNPSEIPNQIRLARSYPQVKGFILYRAKPLIRNPLGVYDSLKYNLFKVPVQLQIASIKPLPAPMPPNKILALKADENSILITWEPTDTITSSYSIAVYEVLKNTILFKDSLFTQSPQLSFTFKKSNFLDLIFGRNLKRDYIFRIYSLNDYGKPSKHFALLNLRLPEIVEFKEY